MNFVGDVESVAVTVTTMLWVSACVPACRSLTTSVFVGAMSEARA